MNTLEERLRRGLESPLAADPDAGILGRIHQGAQRRRRRRTTAVVAASVVVVAGVAGGLTLIGHDSRSVQPLPSPSISTPTPSLPAGAFVGAVDLAVPDVDHVFKLTVNEGCVACSTLWLLGTDGAWERLHDFEGKNAYGGTVDPTFGPVEYVEFAPDARNGWAWGKRLFGTHDGGRTWQQIAWGPGSLTDYGHWVHLTPARAWSLHRSDRFGTELWWTPVGDEDWSGLDARDMGSVVDIETVGDRVVVESATEGAGQVTLRSSTDGRQWTSLELPCPGENQAYPAVTEVFALCGTEKGGAMVYRSVDLSSWELFGHSDLTSVTAVVPLGDDRLLLLGRPHDLAVTPEGSQPVDVGLQRDEEVFQDTGGVAGDTAYLVTSRGRILVSRDAGLTWSELG